LESPPYALALEGMEAIRDWFKNSGKSEYDFN